MLKCVFQFAFMGPNLKFNWSIKKEVSDLVIEIFNSEILNLDTSFTFLLPTQNTNSNCDGLFVCSDESANTAFFLLLSSSRLVQFEDDYNCYKGLEINMLF